MPTASSTDIVIQSPMSITGALARVRRMWHRHVHGPVGILTGTLLVLLAVVWVAVAIVWLVFFGVLLVPYRVIRRGQRRRKLDDTRHRELIEASRRAAE